MDHKTEWDFNDVMIEIVIVSPCFIFTWIGIGTIIAERKEQRQLYRISNKLCARCGYDIRAMPTFARNAETSRIP